ncbi:GntR family transcriptional regulator [Bosea sp. 2KB_26]|uniref:GntR family transcriptional regulator n=1 Tax=Bosea sp. 2KB_26 TaxID=3237475 RepID=UPI003F8E8EF9
MNTRLKSADDEAGSSQQATHGLSRVDYVLQALRDAIQSGKLKQGTRLREEDLAEQFGVSRTPIREALGRMQSRGLVEAVPGRGLIIAEITGTKIIELYSLRAILEGAAARFAAEHASPTEIDILNALAQRCAEAQTPQLAAIANIKFHQMIYEVARNRYLGPALGELQDTIALLSGTTFEKEGRLEEVTQEHLAIIKAIKERDLDAAEAAARAHVTNAKLIRISRLMESGAAY